MYTYPDILRHWNVVISEFWRFWSEFWRFWSEFWRFWSEFWWFWCEFWRFWPEFFVNFDLSFGFLMTFGDFCLKFGEFWGNHSIISIDTQSKCRKIWVLPFSDLSFGKKIWVLKNYLSFGISSDLSFGVGVQKKPCSTVSKDGFTPKKEAVNLYHYW